MSLVVKYSESPVKLMENQKLVEIQFPETATEIIGLKTDNLTKIDVSKCSKDFVNTVKSSYQDKTNNSGDSIKVKEQPNNEIWYTASAKLSETTSTASGGLHTNMFYVTKTLHAFEDGKGVITFNGDVTIVGDFAFYKCLGLTSINIPDGVKTISQSSFLRCSGLKEIHCQSVTPPNVNESNTFSKVNTNYCKLYVPIGSKETYAFAEGWRLFSNIIEENVISDGDNKCAAPSIAFEDGQLKFTSETPKAKFLYTITDTDIKTSLESCEDGNVKLSATYLITAYAEAEGYSTSNATTATLVWLDARLDGTSTDAKEITVNAKPLLITQDAGIVNLSGLQDGEKVSAYDASGKLIATSRAIGAETMIDLSSLQGRATIIKVGGNSVKLMIK